MTFYLSLSLILSQVICSESIAGYIDQHFVMWAYDLTEKRLQQQVLTECQAIFGLSGRKQVNSLNTVRIFSI